MINTQEPSGKPGQAPCPAFRARAARAHIGVTHPATNGYGPHIASTMWPYLTTAGPAVDSRMSRVVCSC